MRAPELRQYDVRAVLRTLDILELLEEPSGRVTLADVVTITGLPKTSAFRYLATLEHRGYVDRTADGGYQLARSVAPARAYDLETIARRALAPLERLRDLFDETVSLGVLDGRRASYLVTVKTHRSVRVEIEHGARAMIHCTAFGKALAANLVESRVRQILALDGMPRFTSRTITDPDQFMHELTRVRRAGYALNNGENEEGARCVALALSVSRIPLAVTLSAPAARLPLARVHEVVTALHEFDAGFGAESGLPSETVGGERGA